MRGTLYRYPKMNILRDDEILLFTNNKLKWNALIFIKLESYSINVCVCVCVRSYAMPYTYIKHSYQFCKL